MDASKITVPIKIDGIEEYKQKLDVLQGRIKLVEEAIEEINEMNLVVNVGKETEEHEYCITYEIAGWENKVNVIGENKHKALIGFIEYMKGNKIEFDSIRSIIEKKHVKDR